MASLRELVQWLDSKLEVSKIRDVAHNGLQVEGRTEIRRIVTGVSANLAFLQAARDKGADAVIVHHGLVWGGIQRVVGPMRKRLKLLLEADMSLLAYHLPLDMHAQLGNNAGLTRALGLVEVQPFGSYKGQIIGMRGSLAQPESLQRFVQRVRDVVDNPIHVVESGVDKVQHVAVCSGGAAELAEEAAEAGCDTFLSGEVAEYSPAIAAEGNIHILAAGHHATERFGVRALAQAVQEHFDVEVEFVDIANKL